MRLTSRSTATRVISRAGPTRVSGLACCATSFNVSSEADNCGNVLSKPDISDETIVSCVIDSFVLRIAKATFLPSGDVNSAVYRIATDDRARYLLKLRRSDFDEVAVAVPAYLHSRGILGVMAPIATKTNQLSIHAHGFDWMLYPYFEGKNGFEVPLSPAQWIALGETMRKVHTTILPTDLARRVPHES